MRLIFIDEAGTSAIEPVCVVAAVIVEADRELRVVREELSRAIFEGVPPIYRNNFLFHATEIFSGGKNIDRNLWSFDDRLDFLKSIVCLPFVHDLPIAIGKVFKGEQYEKMGEMSHSILIKELDNIPEENKRRMFLQKKIPLDEV